MLRKIKTRHIKLAIAVTKVRWIQLCHAKSIEEINKIFDETDCGFCKLDVKMQGNCMNYACPILDDKGLKCCEEFRTVTSHSGSIFEKQAAAIRLIARMDDFDIPEVVKNINKAIAQKGESK